MHHYQHHHHYHHHLSSPVPVTRSRNDCNSDDYIMLLEQEDNNNNNNNKLIEKRIIGTSMDAPIRSSNSFLLPATKALEMALSSQTKHQEVHHNHHRNKKNSNKDALHNLADMFDAASKLENDYIYDFPSIEWCSDSDDEQQQPIKESLYYTTGCGHHIYSHHNNNMKNESVHDHDTNCSSSTGSLKHQHQRIDRSLFPSLQQQPRTAKEKDKKKRMMKHSSLVRSRALPTKLMILGSSADQLVEYKMDNSSSSSSSSQEDTDKDSSNKNNSTSTIQPITKLPILLRDYDIPCMNNTNNNQHTNSSSSNLVGGKDNNNIQQQQQRIYCTCTNCLLEQARTSCSIDAQRNNLYNIQDRA